MKNKNKRCSGDLPTSMLQGMVVNKHNNNQNY